MALSGWPRQPEVWAHSSKLLCLTFGREETGGFQGLVSVCVCAAGDSLCQTEMLRVLGWGCGGGWRARGWAQRLQLKRTSVLRGPGSQGPLGEALSWRWHPWVCRGVGGL